LKIAPQRLDISAASATTKKTIAKRENRVIIANLPFKEIGSLQPIRASAGQLMLKRRIFEPHTEIRAISI